MFSFTSLLSVFTSQFFIVAKQFRRTQNSEQKYLSQSKHTTPTVHLYSQLLSKQRHERTHLTYLQTNYIWNVSYLFSKVFSSENYSWQREPDHMRRYHGDQQAFWTVQESFTVTIKETQTERIVGRGKGFSEIRWRVIWLWCSHQKDSDELVLMFISTCQNNVQVYKLKPHKQIFIQFSLSLYSTEENVIQVWSGMRASTWWQSFILL